MKSLISQISIQADISEDKAKTVLLAISSHVRERFPLLQSIVDLMLENEAATRREAAIPSFPEFGFSRN